MRRSVGFLALSLAVVASLGCDERATVPTPSSAPRGSTSPNPTPAATTAATTAATSTPVSTVSPPDPGIWTVSAVAPMLRARDGFRALVLGDDTVIVVGADEACAPGGASPGSKTSERYDPVADEWSIAASLNNPRKDFAMVPAADGGVMLIGGVNAADEPFSSTKRFDLDAAIWVDGPLLNRAYGDPSAVTVKDGRIFVLGPTITDETNTTSTVEILAPGNDHWDESGRIEGVHIRAVVGLDTGRLVALGSTFEGPDQLYVGESGGAEGFMPFAPTGFEFIERIVAVPGGGVLAFGSSYDPATGDAMPGSPRRHDPATDLWVETGPMSARRTDAQITTLAGGRILVAGGVVGPPRDMAKGEIVRTSEIYDPPTNSWFVGPDLLEIRAKGQAITLNDGSVLMLGGLNARNVGFDTPFCPPRLTSVERLTPAP